jgi:type I restriction enzyme S subunit
MSAIQQLITEHMDIWTGADTGKRSGRGRASGNAGSVYGVKKLRELILELAVRGKLLPQDTNDEPASELLKRIQAQKTKSLAATAEVEKPFDLPIGWEWVSFGEIAQHNSGKTLDKGRNKGVLCDYITTSNLYWGVFELDSVKQMPIEESELERCTAQKGDLLICEGGEAGRAAVWNFDKEVCFQNHVHRARLYEGISPFYAYRYFEKLNASGEIEQYRKGVGISNMSGKALSSVVFSLPPLAEQHRIVTKVDELMALCDQLEAQHSNAAEAHEKLVSHLLGTLTQSQGADDFSANWQRIAAHFDTLFTTEASIDALKQTMLQLAVMGKLVPQNVNDEPASELLKRIQAEKDKLLAEGKIKKEKPLVPVTVDEKPFELPKGWEWVRIGSICHDWGQKTPDIDFTYIEVSAIDNQRGMISSPELVSPENAASRARKIVKKGTVIYSTIRPYLLNIAVIEDEFQPEPIASTAFAIVHPFCLMPPRYFLSYFRSPVFVRYVESVQMGIAYPAINDGQFFSGLIALPPIAEQHRIVAKVDALMALCDQLKTRITVANQQQQKLADVFVAQAVAA